jgi:hypothetical protein
MYLTDFVVNTRIEKNTLGGRGLPCINMGHDAYIPGIF